MGSILVMHRVFTCVRLAALYGVRCCCTAMVILLLMHCAGHINFNDEVSAALRLADGVLLAVDAAEGVMMVTDKVIKQAVAEGLPICLLLTKVEISAHGLMPRICRDCVTENASCEQRHCRLQHGRPKLPALCLWWSCEGRLEAPFVSLSG